MAALVASLALLLLSTRFKVGSCIHVDCAHPLERRLSPRPCKRKKETQFFDPTKPTYIRTTFPTNNFTANSPSTTTSTNESKQRMRVIYCFWSYQEIDFIFVLVLLTCISNHGWLTGSQKLRLPLHG
ncbi:hypothetical protein QBC43DRAFT_142608 [Cladorrhinum sp. PSN259]|nr:hypothetical protein QBC43DRAFT_142608 [Cladorrhinum sp. PSN259]